MKFLKSTILAVLGIAAVMTSCSDDNKYEPAGPAAGVYFSNVAPTSVLISDEETSFDVQVLRTQDAPLSANVTATDASGLFNIPTQVTFESGKLEANLTIGYDPAKLKLETPYQITLKLENEYGYALSEYTFTVKMGQPVVTEKAGLGNYTYNCIWKGTDPGLNLTMAYNPGRPDQITWKVGNPNLPWGAGTILEIDMPDQNDIDEYDCTTVFVHPQVVGGPDELGTNPDYGIVYIADLYSYYKEYRQKMDPVEYADDKIEKFKNYSFYDTETGKFALACIYYIPQYEAGTYYLGSQAYEYFQRDGFPSYGIEIAYDGLFISRNEAMEARATIYCEEDVASVKAVMVEGEDEEAGLAAILSGADNVMEYDGAESIQAAFPIEDGGVYTVVAMSFNAAGESQLYDSDTFEISLSNDNADWNDFGLGDYIDGFVMPGFTLQGGAQVIAAEFMYNVEIQQSKANDNLYRLVRPYGGDYPLAHLNAYPAKRNIEFTIEGENVCMLEQPCGFGASSWGGEMIIGNYEGFLQANNPDASLATISNFIKSKGYNPCYFEDGIVTITTDCLFFGAPKIGNGTFGYNWNNPQEAIIALPQADEITKKLTIAKRTVKPTIKGAVQTIKANKRVSKQDRFKMVMPHKADLNKVKPIQIKRAK